MTKQKHIAIIGTAGVPACYGGFETLVHYITPHLIEKFDVSIYCSTKYYAKEKRQKTFKGAKLIFLPFNANGPMSIVYDIISILHALFYADTLLILGVSGGIILPFVRLFTNKKIIINIDGLEWRRAKWSKPIKAFLKFSERLAVKFSHADITDNEAIKKYTAINYKTLSYLVAYGADHVQHEAITMKDYQIHPFLMGSYAFKVCRIEPENNIEMILKAFSRTKHILVLVGNWNHSIYAQNLRAQYKGFENLKLLDPIYDQKALNKLRANASLYVHGHSAGGTNPSLVEAMYLGLPIFCFNVSYNKATTEHQALYFKNVSELLELLKNTTLEQRLSLAQNMKAIADRRYTWKHIAKKYESLILSFDFAYQKPEVQSKLSVYAAEKLKNSNSKHLLNTRHFYQS